MESITGITAFVRAAEQRSYVAAGRVIGTSPSAVAKSVARLESRLGVRLLHRTTRSISLSEEGRVFYERCRRILDDLKDAEAIILKSREQPSGRLRISVPHIVGHHLLMPRLPGFVDRFPDVELDIDFEDRVVDLIAEGVDIAIRSGVLTDTRLIARALGEQHFTVCGSPDYLRRHGCPETPADLDRHVSIQFKYPSSGRIAPWAFQPPDDRLLLPKRLTFNNTDAGLRAALDGLGLSHLPVYVARPHIESGTLRPVLTAFMTSSGSLALVWPSNRQLSPKIRAFVDFVVELVAAQPDAFRASPLR